MNKLSMFDVRVSKIMTKGLITAALNYTVEVAVKKMVDNNVEFLPVIDSEEILLGLITFRDVVTKVVYPSALGWELKVEESMIRDVTTCNPDSTVLVVVKTMKNRHLRRIPIVNADKVLLGIVINFDLALFGSDFEYECR